MLTNRRSLRSENRQCCGNLPTGNVRRAMKGTAKDPALSRDHVLRARREGAEKGYCMHFKIVPAIGPRYWVGIMIASICGANMGDFIPDVLKLSDLGGLLMLALIFAVIALANQWSRRGNEALYWPAILVVRAAATNLADLGIHRTHLDYITVSACLAALLVAILAWHRAPSLQPVTGGLPSTNGLYWLAMLTAGTLGTVLGDGIGHMIHPITVGVPISAIIATGAVALILAQKTRLDMASAGAASYWAAIVAVRTWGTNFGDIAAFFLSLPVSMMLSGLLLAGMLIVWREPSNPIIPAAT
jgi:uncharacterized membrane-anchored protein